MPTASETTQQSYLPADQQVDHLPQARLAAYTAERVPGIDQHEVYGRLGSLAAGGLVASEGVHVDYRQGDYIPNNEAGQKGTVKAAADGRRTVIDAHDYSQWLTENGDAAHVTARVEIMAAYDQYADKVKPFMGVQEDVLRNSPQFLGAGGNSIVVKIDNIDDHGKPLVARVARAGKTHGVVQLDGYIDGMSRGVGVDGLEQMVAASYEDGVTISEEIPGHEGGKWTDEDLAAMDRRNFLKLFGTLDAMQQRQLLVDTSKFNNLRFDPDAGFTVLDYSHDVQPLEDKLRNVVRSMEGDRCKGGYAKAERAAENLEPVVHTLEVMAEAADEYYGPGASSDLVRGKLADYQQQLADYRNPDKIAAELAAQAAKHELMLRMVAEASDDPDGDIM